MSAPTLLRWCVLLSAVALSACSGEPPRETLPEQRDAFVATETALPSAPVASPSPVSTDTSPVDRTPRIVPLGSVKTDTFYPDESGKMVLSKAEHLAGTFDEWGPCAKKAEEIALRMPDIDDFHRHDSGGGHTRRWIWRDDFGNVSSVTFQWGAVFNGCEISTSQM